MERVPAITRRDTVRRATLAGAGVLGAGSVLAMVSARPAGAEESDVLERAIRFEREAAALYEAMVEEDLLDEEVANAATSFAKQQREHVAALLAALEEGGAPAPEPPPDQLETVQELDDQREALELAIDHENALIRLYREAVGELTGLATLKTIAEIAFNASQHIAVLRQQLGEPAVPDAFVTGKSEAG